MSKPIYVLYLIHGWTEAWYQLSKEEQDNLWSKVDEVNKSVGMEWIIACDSRWADEENLVWSVAKYPDLESLQKKVVEIEKLEWSRYMSSKSILGTKMGE